MIAVDEYTIVSINDERKAFKAAIDARVGGIKKTWGVEFIDGHEASIGTLQGKFKVDDIWHEAKIGEVGLWFSFLNACKYAADNNKTLLVFEDDAIITSHNFKEDLERLLEQVPDDADAFSVMSPSNQQVTAYIEWINRDSGMGIQHSDIAPPYRVPGAHLICKAYQGYSFVSMIYTPKGAKKILRRVQKTGMYTPADCWLFEQAEQGHLDVYTPVPTEATLVDVDWDNQAPTTIHSSGLHRERLTDL